MFDSIQDVSDLFYKYNVNIPFHTNFSKSKQILEN